MKILRKNGKHARRTRGKDEVISEREWKFNYTLSERKIYNATRTLTSGHWLTLAVAEAAKAAATVTIALDAMIFPGFPTIMGILRDFRQIGQQL